MIAVVVALMPLAAPGASWVAAGVGVVAGILVGLPLALTATVSPATAGARDADRPSRPGLPTYDQ